MFQLYNLIECNFEMFIISNVFFRTFHNSKNSFSFGDHSLSKSSNFFIRSKRSLKLDTGKSLTNNKPVIVSVCIFSLTILLPHLKIIHFVTASNIILKTPSLNSLASFARCEKVLTLLFSALRSHNISLFISFIRIKYVK